MNIAKLSINRPIFISSIVILIVFTGWFALNKLGVDLFPDINIPVVAITTVYPGAGPEEIESLVSRPIEEEIGSISGLKKLSSRNQEGISIVTAEFFLTADIKDSEQQVRNKIARIRRDLPTDIEEPVIQRFDPADQPIVRLSLFGEIAPVELYDIATEELKPQLEQVNNVGSVKIIGGAKRQIQIEVDRKKLNEYQLSNVFMGNQLKSFGLNVPVGKYESGSSEVSFRTIGRFETLSEIEEAQVFFGGELGSSVPVSKIATVVDTIEDPKTMCFLYAPVKEESEQHSLIGGFINSLRKGDPPKIERVAKPSLFIDVYKQSGANTVAVVDAIVKKVEKMNSTILKDKKGNPNIVVVRDSSIWIRANVEDVTVSIILGILLTVIVVYLFLGNVRSTIITGLALPNSLLGAFIIMYAMGFTLNVMTLLALSLTVGLLVDDAIVVRENIFRKLEEGLPPSMAAELGTNEVTLAVVATSLTVIAVFLPIGFLSGVVGQFFKQFGLTVVFAMIVSLFDALTIAPMLSAYFAGKVHAEPNIIVRAFDKFQTWLEKVYGIVIDFAVKRPLIIILSATLIFIFSIYSLTFVKKTFMGSNDQGEFMVAIDMPPGTSLAGTHEVIKKIEEKLKKNLPELHKLATVVGSPDGFPTIGNVGITIVPTHQRRRNTATIKAEVREMMKEFEFARPSVNDFSAIGGGVQYPFNLNIMGDDLETIEKYSKELIEKLKVIPDLTDVERDYQAGKPEFQIEFDFKKMQNVGVAPVTAGAELRYHVEGGVVGKFHDKGLEYDILMRLKPDQRNLRSAYLETRVPNVNFKMIHLNFVSTGKEKLGPAKISREDRSRVIPIRANLSATGAIGNATDTARKIIESFPPPPGVRFAFYGQSESFRELMENIIIAFGFALLFIYLVLASLYESFITPISVLIAIPPAFSGAFLALALFGEMLNLFSMIGIILLMGLVTKNSILIVDYAVRNIKDGMDRTEAIKKAGVVRLRPILMTSLAMIAGTLPIALGLGEAAKSRTAMGIAIIGGLILSTLLTLIVVPSVFGYVDRLREWVESKFRNE
jgi:HAE1 family hydrophobic/amphiphilic exporter-1